MKISDVNFWAVLVAAFSSIALGALWYSPLLFLKSWMAENGFTEESMKGKNPLTPMISAFILNIVMAFNLAMFLAGPPDFVWGLAAGGLAGIGWVAISIGVIYLFEGKSLRLFLINGGYCALSFIIMGGILGVWK
jgi:hypothetical protein